MKNHNAGDLVHVPAGAYRMKLADERDQYKIPFTANILRKPLVGIFKEPVDHTTSIVVFYDGEWVVENSCVYCKNEGGNNVGNNKHKEQQQHLASV